MSQQREHTQIGLFTPWLHFNVLKLTKRSYHKIEHDSVQLECGGISFLKTVNTLQVALQKHKGGDGPSKHEAHLQRCQESPREHMPHNRGISGHRRYPPKAHLDSLGCKSLSDPNRSIAG